MGDVEERTTTRTARLRRDWPPSLHSGFGTFVVAAPIVVVVSGVVLDRAGYSAVGITLTMVGAITFLAMLYIVGSAEPTLRHSQLTSSWVISRGARSICWTRWYERSRKRAASRYE